MTLTYAAVPVTFGDEKTHRRILAEAINRHNQGKFNVFLPVTLNASATTTTIQDARITATSIFTFTPTTADAATAAPNIYVSSQQTGQATLTHASSANADQTFNVGIFG
jgi:hypothetical protein